MTTRPPFGPCSIDDGGPERLREIGFEPAHVRIPAPRSQRPCSSWRRPRSRPAAGRRSRSRGRSSPACAPARRARSAAPATASRAARGRAPCRAAAARATRAPSAAAPEPQQIRDRGARPADGVRGIGVREPEFLDEAVQRARFLDRVQVSRAGCSRSARRRRRLRRECRG